MYIRIWKWNILSRTEYDTETKVGIFNDLSYAARRNDFNNGTQLNLANFNGLYGMIYFDLTNQTEKVTRDPKQLRVPACKNQTNS